MAKKKIAQAEQVEKVEEAAEVEAAAKPKKQAKPQAEVEALFVVTTPHGEGMRVFGVYSSEKKAEAALEADPRAQHARSPFLGWWILENASLASTFGEPDRLHFCSWECLGAFVLEKSGDVAELQRRISDL